MTFAVRLPLSNHLRIAVIAPYDLSRPGGVNNQIRGQARALRRLGHAVCVYGPASAALGNGEVSLGRALGINLSGTEARYGLDPRAFVRVERMMREPMDILHVHEPLSPLPPWIALARARVPIVGTFHVHREGGHKWLAATAWLLRPFARRLDARIAVSDAARRTIEPLFPGSYQIVPNGIEGDRFREPHPRPDVFEHGYRHVLCVGRLEPRKGVEYLVRAMADVQRRLTGTRLIVAGDGPDRARLMRLAGELGTTAAFVGLVADSDLPAYFQAADVVSAPAVGGESFGLVLLEAMAAGRPVVASRIAGYEELVGTRDCVRLVPPGEPILLARELETLLANPDLCRRLGAAGATAAFEFEWTTIAHRLVEIYQSVLARRQGR